MRRLHYLALTAYSFLSILPANAYDIRTRIRVFNQPAFELGDIHETITGLAEQCVDRARSEHPQNCWESPDSIARLATSEAHETYSTLQLATRWPDDPTRQSALVTYPKVGINLRVNCERLTQHGVAIERIGLLCSSHYGRLQFMHAMASNEDANAAQTYDRIMAWADFAYAVAAGERSVEDNYCAAFDAQPDAIRTAFGMADRSWCAPRPSRFLSGPYPAWTVRTLFTMTCSNPFSSATCSEYRAGPVAERLARDSATGALLHLVQDSFSQAHAARWVTTATAETGPFESQVVCRYPSAYFNYARQDSDVHSRADKPPARDRSCDGQAQTDDVITASAMVIWMVRHQRPAAEFRAYLETRVFGPRP